MARSIIGAGFDDYVKEQINLRQKNNALVSFKSKDLITYQNTNDAFLRLTSGVDVNFTNTDAYNFQLFSTRFGGPGASGSFASGVGIGATSTYAYGFLSDGSYGFSPPPGLTSADIKALNRGSLREATVQILAHNSAQFEIIERLYLRLGYSMLLEWGHNMYFDNSNVLQRSNPHEVYSKFLYTNSYENILNAIRDERLKSDGNYDAMVGLVKNFSWNLKRDGSYDITLDILSTGDVIESLKSNTSHPVTDASKVNTQDIPENQPPLQFNAQKTTLNKILWYFTEKLSPTNMKLDGSHKFYLQGDETTAALISAGTGLNANQYNNSPSGSQGDVIGFLFPQLNGVNVGQDAGYNAQYFIKLGVFLRCLQNFCLLYNPKQNNESIFKFNWNDEENFCFTYPRHGSLDPRVCLIDVSKDVTLDTFNLTGTSSLPPPDNYNKNDYYYEYKQLALYEWDIASSQYLVRHDAVFDFGQGFGVDEPYDLEEYWEPWDEKPGLTPAFEGWIKSEMESFEKRGAITKTTPTPAGFTTDLNNISVNIYSDSTIDILNYWTTNQVVNDNKYNGFTLQELTSYNTNANLYNAYTPQTIVEGKEYITQAGVIRSKKAVDLGKNAEVIDFDKIKSELAAGLTTISTPRYIAELTTYAVVGSIWTKVTTGYSGTNVGSSGDVDVDVSNNLFDQIRNGSKFRVDHCDYPFIGRTMNIYINMNFISKILQDYVDVGSGAIAMYDLLDKTMKGVQNALGNLNNFNITYDENTNEFSIQDSTFIPGLDKYLESTLKDKNPFRKKPVEFITHTLTPTEGSFMRDASVKTKLSNNFQTMVTVGAQANKNVVGTNSTGLAVWNAGLTDRIIEKKTSVNNKDGTKPDDIVVNFLSNVGIVQNLYNAINDGNITDQQIDGAKDAGIDLFNYEVGTYVNDGIIPGIGFIPIDLELTMEGLSGMKIYESYTADTKLLPPRYKDAIQFVITGISHKIQNNDWTTTIQSISGPRFDGVPVKNPPALKTTKVTVIKDPRFKPSNNPDDSSDSIVSGGTGGTPGVTRIRVVRSYADQNQIVSRLVLINVDGNGNETVIDDNSIWMLENPWLNNQKATMSQQSSCVPLGYYNAKVEYVNRRGKIIRILGFSDGSGGNKSITSNGITRDGVLWHPGGNTKWKGLDPEKDRWSTGCLLFATSAITNTKDSNGYFIQTAESDYGTAGGKTSNVSREQFFDLLANKMNLTNNDLFDFEIVVAGTGNAAGYSKLSIHQPANDRYFG
jgi:hypothetical protein